MRVDRPKLLLAAAAISTLALAGAGFAQMPPAPPPPPHGGPGGFAHDCQDDAARSAAMLAFAEVKLAITDAERSDWNEFATKIRAADQPLAAACHQLADKPPSGSLPERLALMDQIETARTAKLHQVRLAVDEIYARLTPEQKRIADHLMPEPGGPGHEPPHPGFPPGGFDGPPPPHFE